jgi:CRP-like cAMP-binding protein
VNLQDLRKSALFEGLSDDELQQLMDNARPVSLRAGDVLMKQGDPGDTAYVVVSGEFEVHKQSGNRRSRSTSATPAMCWGKWLCFRRRRAPPP